MRIYCEHGVRTRDVRRLAQEHGISLLHFPYDPDSYSRRGTELAAPTEARWDDLHVPWQHAEFAWDATRPSDLLPEIERIIGSEHRRDILHVDSAVKSGCTCFLTADSDVLSKRRDLELLLGIRIFNPVTEFEALRRYVRSRD